MAGAFYQPDALAELGNSLAFAQKSANDIWKLGFGHQAEQDIAALGQSAADEPPGQPPTANAPDMGSAPLGPQMGSLPVVISPRPDARTIADQQQAQAPDPQAQTPSLADRALNWWRGGGQQPAAPDLSASPDTSGLPPPPTWGGPQAATPASGPTQAQAPQQAPAPAAGDWAGRAYAAAVAAGHPNPAEFVEQMRQESQFDPDVISGKRASPAGAQGIAQIMPDVAAKAGVNPLDPDSALKYAAQRMANNYRTYGGDSARALAEYNMGAGNLQKYGPTGLPETAKYISIIQGRTQANQAQAQQAATVAPPPISMPPGTYTPETLTPNQLSEGVAQGLTTQEALAVCGPAATVAFARANGRNPSLLEAKDMAQKLGLWDASVGMHGPTSEVQLLNAMGVPSSLQQGVDWGRVAQEVQSGRPVILDSPQHYYVASGFDPQTGEFELGQSANVLAKSGGKTRWRPDEIPSLGMGNVRATIYMGGAPASGGP